MAIVKKLVPSHAREIAQWTDLDIAEVTDVLRSTYTSKYGVFNNDVLFGILVISKISNLKHIVKWHYIFPHTEEELLYESDANELLLDRALADIKPGVNIEFEVSEWKTDLHLLLKSLGFKAYMKRGLKEDTYCFELIKEENAES